MRFFFKMICTYLILLLGLPSNAQYSCMELDPMLTKNASHIIRNQIVKFTINDIDDAILYRKEAVTFLKKNSRSQTFSVNYDNKSNEIRKLSITLYDANGKLIRKIAKKEIQDVSAIDGWMENSRAIIADLSYSSYPYTAVYEYEKKLDSNLFIPSWTLNNINKSIENSTFAISCPKSLSLGQKMINMDIEPIINHTENADSYIWKAKDIQAKVYEEHMPSPYKGLPQLKVMPNKFSYYGYEGSMETWKEYGEFYYNLNKGRDQLSEETISTIRDLTKNCNTDKEKIAVLYKAMQDKVRYISVQLDEGGWQTFEANYVEKNEFGDCKALSNYMIAMLKVIDIDAKAVLVYAGRDYFYESVEEFTYPGFNHVICYIPSEDIWLECTSTISPPNYLGSSTSDRTVLMIDPVDSKLIKTPSYTDNRQIRDFEVKIDEKGTAQITGHIEFRERAQEVIREGKSVLTDKEMDIYIKNLIDLNGVEIKDYTIEVNEELPIVTLDIEMEIRKFANVSGNRIFVPILNLAHRGMDLPKSKDREHPVEIKNRTQYVDNIKINLPDNFKIESSPKPTSKIDDDYFDFTIELVQNGNQIEVKRNCVIKESIVNKDAYSDLQSSMKEVSKLNNSKIVLVKS